MAAGRRARGRGMSGGYRGMRDAGSIPGTLCAHHGEKQPPSPKARRVQEEGVRGQRGVQPGAPVPIAHPLAVLYNGTKLSPCTEHPLQSPWSCQPCPGLLLPPNSPGSVLGAVHTPKCLSSVSQTPKQLNGPGARRASSMGGTRMSLTQGTQWTQRDAPLRNSLPVPRWCIQVR